MLKIKQMQENVESSFCFLTDSIFAKELSLYCQIEKNLLKNECAQTNWKEIF